MTHHPFVFLTLGRADSGRGLDGFGLADRRRWIDQYIDYFGGGAEDSISGRARRRATPAETPGWSRATPLRLLSRHRSAHLARYRARHIWN